MFAHGKLAIRYHSIVIDLAPPDRSCQVCVPQIENSSAFITIDPSPQGGHLWEAALAAVSHFASAARSSDTINRTRWELKERKGNSAAQNGTMEAF